MKVDFQRIVCATDLSEYSNNAVSHAVAVTEQFGGKLFLCYVVDLPVKAIPTVAYLHSAEYEESMKADARGQMETLLAGQSIDWEPLILSGPVAETLAAQAAEKQADLLISATHGRSGLKRLFLGSVTERLIRTIPCPLLIVTPPGPKIDTAGIRKLSFNRILVGCDFSADSDAALAYGFSLAQEFESELHLIHVMEPFTYRDMHLPYAMLEDLTTHLQPRLEEKMSALIPKEVLDWCTVTTRFLTGAPYEELTDYATDHGIDLIIMGVRGRSLVETLLLGSTTDRVMRHAPCPVLSVSPDRKKAAGEKASASGSN